MSEVRPGGSDGDGAAMLLASARARVRAASADLALPSELRLTEWQRTTMRALLAQLVRTVEDELRAVLAADAPAGDALAAALSSAHVEIALPVLAGSDALAEPALVGLLLRRTEEHRLHRAAVAENALLLELAGDPDPSVAREAMGLLIAQNGRLDMFREPLLPLSDLPAEVEHHLVWAVAAALRRYMVERHDAAPAACDAALGSAALRLLARHDEGESAHARAARLALAVGQNGRLFDDDLLARAAGEGAMPLFFALLALRSGLSADAVWELLTAHGGAAPLLRAARVGRDAAAAVLLAISAGEARLGAMLDRFDGTAEDTASSLLSLWLADPAYRDAVARLGR